MTQISVEHTLDCIVAQAHLDAWLAAWPDHCPICEGHGQFVEQDDPSPAGVSLGAGFMVDASPCEACTSEGKCPRCGKPGLSNEDQERGAGYGEGPCVFCGWDYSQGGKPSHRC